MNLEQSEILKGFCNQLKESEIICSKCASKLQVTVTGLLIPEFKMETTELHNGCITNILTYFKNLYVRSIL